MDETLAKISTKSREKLDILINREVNLREYQRMLNDLIERIKAAQTATERDKSLLKHIKERINETEEVIEYSKEYVNLTKKEINTIKASALGFIRQMEIEKIVKNIKKTLKEIKEEIKEILPIKMQVTNTLNRVLAQMNI
ncbi:hypothetical protein J5893_01345 [bacterium]|nr:hypothetical protein [bacterium]